MFFIGLLIGAGIYFIAFLVWYKFDSMGWAIAVTIGICIVLFFISPRICGGAVSGTVAITVVGYFIAKKREKNVKQRESEREAERLLEQSFYKSHCWNCSNPIDGSINKKCPKCNTYYICPKCGMCKCDYNREPLF